MFDLAAALTLAIVALFHVVDWVWVYYQVNVRGPARTKGLVNQVLDERAPPLLNGGLDPKATRAMRTQQDAERFAYFQRWVLEKLAGRFGATRASQILTALPETFLRSVARSDELRWWALLEPVLAKAAEHERTQATRAVASAAAQQLPDKW
jgi:hypothetical protein